MLDVRLSLTKSLKFVNLSVVGYEKQTVAETRRRKMLDVMLSTGEKIRILWKHNRVFEKYESPDPKTGQVVEKTRNHGGSTECQVFLVGSDNTETPFGEGKAMCVAWDNFDKNKGRKYSLRRALQKALPERTGRVNCAREIWASYFQRFPIHNK